jgi:low affinity Fe/Cu permease
LEEELERAEEQENALIKIKDLYKDEIKNLIKKNEELAKGF